MTESGVEARVAPQAATLMAFRKSRREKGFRFSEQHEVGEETGTLSPQQSGELHPQVDWVWGVDTSVGFRFSIIRLSRDR
jgi:hypothetical protein